jgi:succinyl-CoA synthetase alpha subunit
VEGGEGTAKDKIKALQEANVQVAKHPEEIPSLLK